MSNGLEEVSLEKPEVKRKKHSPAGIVILAVTVLFLLLLTAGGLFYYKKADFYKSHFFPGVTINKMDCSDLDVATVVSMIDRRSKEYTLTVYGQDDDRLGELNPEDIGLSIDVEEDVEKLLQQQDPWRWILASDTGASYDIVYEVAFDEKMLKEQILLWDAFQKDKMEAPQDACLSEYLSEEKGYRIVPETRGSLIDADKACAALSAAVQSGETSVNLEDAGCYVRPKVTSESEDLLEKAAILNKMVGTRITYDWNGEKIVLDGDTIHEWIVEEDGAYTVDEEAVKEFVAAHAKENDTYGKKRKFVTTQGNELTLLSGAYGWKTDREEEAAELTRLIMEGAKEEREPVYSFKGAHKGKKDDIGSSYVEIDLTNQHLYLYIDGAIVLESDLVSGNVSRGNTTPPGVFGLTYKTTDATLRGATYNSHVNYWMPFNGDIGMHDATWRSAFGGDIYLTNGSHGCINLPLDKASQIYGYVSKGFPVICYY